MHRRTLIISLAVLAAAAGLTGCVERTITVTSDPSGALVYLNDTEIGRTPVTVPFTFYGTYDVRLEHDGKWLPRGQAIHALGVDEARFQQLVDEGLISVIEMDGQSMAEVRYSPLWTSRKAEVPWWETIGVDLLAELKPGRTHSRIAWHFDLEPVLLDDEGGLMDRAATMRAMTKQEFAEADETPEQQ